MAHETQFYIDGAWVDPITPKTLDVIDPSTEEAFAKISLGSAADVDRAVAAAKRAFPAFARTSREERLALLRRILEIYQRRAPDIALAVSREMGAPRQMALDSQTWAGSAHLARIIEALETFQFQRAQGTSMVVKEPVGVVGMIT
uniref:aldehyde dehydrogenase family protein n=1 Tax=Inquilinus sp. TaxID=1932117 RepID=UPI003784C526